MPDNHEMVSRECVWDEKRLLGFSLGMPQGVRQGWHEAESELVLQRLSYESQLALLMERAHVAESCSTADVTANLTADLHAWMCEEEGQGPSVCGEDEILDEMLRDTCGFGWKEASDQWHYWQSQAEWCEGALERATGRKMSRPRYYGGLYR